MDEQERYRIEAARNRTAQARLEFIATELHTARTFAAVAASHYGFGERREARHAREEASKALQNAVDTMDQARAHGFSTDGFDETLHEVRASVSELYATDNSAA